MVALGEQEAIIRAGIRRVGLAQPGTHDSAADAFDTGARGEWQRIARAALPTWGMA